MSDGKGQTKGERKGKTLISLNGRVERGSIEEVLTKGN